MMMPCCCGCDPAPTPVPRFTNVTTVNGGASPYKRLKDACLSGSCVSYECGEPGQPVCSTMNYDGTSFDWQQGIQGIDNCTGGALVSKILDNCYSHDGSTMYSIPSHCGYGWKGVSAYKLWQGMFGFVESGASCCPDGGITTNKFKSQSTSEQGQSHYRIEVTDRCDEGPDSFIDITYEHNVQQTATSDDYGNVSRSGSIRMLSKIETEAGPNSYLSSCRITDCNGNGVPGLTWPNGAPAIPEGDWGITAECGIISFPYPGSGIVTTGTAAELNAMEFGKAPTDYSYIDAGGHTHTVEIISNQAGTFTLSNDELKFEWEVSYIDTVVPRDCDDFPDDRSIVETFSLSYSKTISLSGETSYATCVGEANTLMSPWRLDDDLQYPWRTDDQTWFIPFVTFDEGGGFPGFNFGYATDCDESSRSTVWGVPATCDGCVFPNDIYYTGEIRGAPLPNGYGPHFNHYHKVYDVCCGLGVPGVCITGLGEMGASPLPNAATQWPDYATAWNFSGHGAHVSQYAAFSQQPEQGAYVQKWAETFVQWPAINLSRPCGRDRYLFDEANTACGSLAGYDLTLETSASLSGKVAIQDGVYQITGGSGTNYTVSDRLYDMLIDCDCIAPLRFPTARAICSSISATAVQTSPGLVTVTCAKKHWLKRGGTESDTVTFNGIAGLTTAAATVTGDMTFTVSGTLTTSPSSGTVSHGATSAQIAYDSTCSRNTFIVRQWDSRFREAVEDGDPAYVVTETQEAKTPNTRHPTVLYCTPNGESFPYGFSVPFPSLTSADMCHGRSASVRFEQAIPDPLWQGEHTPCGHSGAWSVNSNPCDVPDSNHYAFPPLVEALKDLPPGAPNDFTFFDEESQGIPGAVGRPNCSPNPNGVGHAMSWRPSWLTCTDWQELIGHKC